MAARRKTVCGRHKCLPYKNIKKIVGQGRFPHGVGEMSQSDKKGGTASVRGCSCRHKTALRTVEDACPNKRSIYRTVGAIHESPDKSRLTYGAFS